MTDSLSIDMTDPSVRRMLGDDPSRIHQKREMVQLAGDDPYGPDHGGPLKGMSTTRLDTGKIEILVSYRGRVGDFDLTVDLYSLPGQPHEIHLICPKCRNKNRITGERKKIEFDPSRSRPYTFVDGSRMPFNGGELNVEAFQCGWEMQDAGEHKQVERFGMTLCKMTMEIANSVAKDA